MMKGYLARLVERAQPSPHAPVPSAHPRPPATAAAEWEEIVEMVAPPSTSPPERVASRSADALDRSASTGAPAPVVLEPPVRESRTRTPPLTLESSAVEQAPFQVRSPAAGAEEPPAPTPRLSPPPVPAVDVAAPEATPLAFVPPVSLRPPAPDTSPVNLEWLAPTVPVPSLESETPQTLRMAAPSPEQPAAVPGDRPVIDHVERPPSLVIGQLRVEVVRASPGGATAAPIPARPARTTPRTPPAARLHGAVPSVQRFARGRL